MVVVDFQRQKRAKKKVPGIPARLDHELSTYDKEVRGLRIWAGVAG